MMDIEQNYRITLQKKGLFYIVSCGALNNVWENS